MYGFMKEQPKQNFQLMPVPINLQRLKVGGKVPYIPIDMSQGIFKTGGQVKKVKGKMNAYAKKNDTIPAILQVGEYVIPKKDVKYNKKFKEYLKTKKK